MSSDAFDHFSEHGWLSDDGRVGFLCTVLDIVAELLDLAFNNGTLNFVGTWGNPKDVATTRVEFTDLDEPDVVIHHNAKLFEDTLFCNASNSSKWLSHDGNKHVHEDQLND